MANGNNLLTIFKVFYIVIGNGSRQYSTNQPLNEHRRIR